MGASEGGLGSGEEGGRHSLRQQDSGPVNSLGGGGGGGRGEGGREGGCFVSVCVSYMSMYPSSGRSEAEGSEEYNVYYRRD